MATGKTKRTRRNGGTEERRKNCHPLGSRIKPREPPDKWRNASVPNAKTPPGGRGVFSAQRRGKLGYWSRQVVVGSMFAHVIGLLAVDLRSCLANHLEKDGLAAQTGRAVAKINARSWPLVTCSAMDGRAWGRLDESGQGTPTCLSLRRKAPSRISCGISCQDLSLTPNSGPSSQLPNFPTSCHLLNFVPQQPTYSRPPTTK